MVVVTTPDPAVADETDRAHAERLFPTLTPQQISRIAVHGRRRSTARDEVLVNVADKVVPFFLVLSGEIQVRRPSAGAELLIVRLREGQFSGEANMISGRRSMIRLSVSEPGELI